MDVQLLPTSPQPVAAETWVVPTLAADGSGGYLGAHTLVIRGREPVIVDTGVPLVREQWLDHVFGIVEPEDVRWVFLSHDDHDHVGNLEQVLDRCRNATLVGNFSMTARLAGSLELPLERMRWVDAGESFDAGDRTLTAVRPPLFDSPATRGLFDSKTGVLWAVDSFGALVQGEVYEADDVAPPLYDETFPVLNSWNTPWLEWVDTARFAAHVERASRLPITASASAHGPILRGDRIADTVARTLALAAQPAIPTPGQETLDALVAAAFAPSDPAVAPAA